MHIGNNKVAKLLSRLLFIIFCLLCGLVIQTFYETYKVEETKIQLSSIKEEKKEEWSVELKDINPDYSGWINVWGTKVDYPVVLGKSNEEYLAKDFYGEKSRAGTLFYDETTDLSEIGNRIIYGHKMKDNTMFGTLDRFKDKNFFKDNGYVTLTDINGEHIYRIFAAMVVPGSAESIDFINIQQWNNSLSKAEKEEMLQTIKKRASIYQEPFKTADDTFLFLVTCDYTHSDGRLVLVARSISTEE